MNNFTLLDGGIVGVYLLVTMAAGVRVRKYVGKVEDFLLAPEKWMSILASHRLQQPNLAS